MLFRSTKMRYHKNAFGELANYSETPLNNIFSGPENGKWVPTFLSRIHYDQSTSVSKHRVKQLLAVPKYVVLIMFFDNNTESGSPFQWRHNERDGVSNHWRLNCLLNRLLMRGSKKTSKLRVTGLCDRWPVDSPQRASKYFHLIMSSWWVGLYSRDSHLTDNSNIYGAQLIDDDVVNYIHVLKRLIEELLIDSIYLRRISISAVQWMTLLFFGNSAQRN